MFKQIIAPIVITITLIIIMIGYSIAIIALRNIFPLFVIILLGFFIIMGVIISIITLIERIKELKKGENNDLSKY